MNSIYKTNIRNMKKEGAIAPQKSKINFNNLKKNTFHSLNEIECFLNYFCNFIKYVKLYKFFK